MGKLVTANGAQCPVCRYVNDMPLECLRERFEALDCGRCGEALQYCGRHIAGGDFEIVTRTPPPVRVQLRRTKGWRMPANTVKVSRPGPWGNPFNLRAPDQCWTAIAFGHRADPAGRHAASVTMYRLWLAGGSAATVDGCGLYAHKGKKTVAFAESPAIVAPAPPTRDKIRSDLAGKNLACWCKPDQPCHADVLLELANAPALPPTTDGEGR